jgi:hypothetical protein
MEALRVMNKIILTTNTKAENIKSSLRLIGSRDSSVGIAISYGLDDQEGRELGKKFSLLHIVQIGSGVHPTSYELGTEGSFPGVKRQGREADHSPPTSAEVKKMWIYTSTHPCAFMA